MVAERGPDAVGHKPEEGGLSVRHCLELGKHGHEVAVVAQDGDELRVAGDEVGYGVHGDGHVGGVLGVVVAEVLDALDGNGKGGVVAGGPHFPEGDAVGADVEVEGAEGRARLPAPFR